MSSDLLELSAAEAIAQIRAGSLDSDELYDAYARAIQGDRLNAYLWRAEPGMRGSGGEVLRGLPVAVKDLFCTEGIETTAGSRILEGYRPPYTATAVRRLTDAGARVLGKTNMDEFAMGSSNENSAYGPVLNPWDHSRVPGGSSGGSAAAVAGGLAPWALGTDTGGSIRQPAALCGIVGLKPTYGAISRYGMVAFASSLDQCGPLTRDVTDAALLLSQMQGHDPRDSTSVGIAGGVAMPARADLEGLRIGVASDFSQHAEGVEPGVAEVFEKSLGVIEASGATLEEVQLPNAEHGISAYYVLAPAEASANLARYDGVRYGLRLDGEADLATMYERTRARGFGDEVKRRIMLGTYALSSGYYDAYYGRAQRVRTKIVEDFRAAFAEVDLIVTPTSPSVAFRLGEKAADPLAMYLSDYFTVPMSLAGIPAISIPAGLAEPPGGGPMLPVGLQITAPAFAESRLLDAAYALEQRIGFSPRPVTASGSPPQPTSPGASSGPPPGASGREEGSEA